MKRSKFYSLLQTLSDQELKVFAIHLKENRHNLGVAFSIFEHIRKYAPHYNAEHELDRDFFIEKYFQTSPDINSRKRFYNELSKLSNQLKDFLVCQRVKSQAFEKNMILAQILKERKLRKESEAALRKAQKTISILPRDSASAQPNSSFQLLKHLICYDFKYNSTESLKLTSDPRDIQLLMESLDLFYLSSKLKYSCELESRNKIKKEETLIYLIDDSIDLVNNNTALNIPIIEVYLQSYQMIVDQSPERFKNIYQCIEKHKHEISNADQKIIFTYLINFCAIQIREGKKDYLKEAYKLYEYLRRESLLLDDGVIATTRFNNFVDAACKVRSFNKAEEFIRSHAKFLPKDIRTETVRLAEAMIYFEKGEYDKSRELLGEGSFKNIEHNLRKRWLLICCYCAQKESTLLDAECDSTRQYLKRVRVKINKETIKGTQNLITVTRQIDKYRYQNKNKKEQIMKKLNALNPIIFKTWLEMLIHKM